MPTLTINRDHLRAVACFAAVKDCRWYLNGVCIQLRPIGARMVATNGHVLGMLPIAADNGETMPTEATEIIIPAEALKPFMKAGARGSLNVLILTYGTDGPCKLAEVGGVALEFAPVDGKFPDVDRVIPSAFNGTRAHFNFAYLALFDKANKILGSSLSPSTMHNGQSAALVDMPGAPDFIGIIMPLRGSDPTLPEWYAQAYRTAPEELAIAA